MSKRLEVELDIDLTEEQYARAQALIAQDVPDYMVWREMAEGALRDPKYKMHWFVQAANVVDY